MSLEPGNACSHCTFINTPGRVRCAMCFRNIRKRTSDGATESRTESRPSHPQNNVQPEEPKMDSVPTLFSTAAGQPVAVSETALQAARERLDAEDTQMPPKGDAGGVTVPTLFSTAAGQPVAVSETALQAARERLDADNCTTSSSGSENSAGAAVQSSSAATPSFAGPRRGRFVVPFARAPRPAQAMQARLREDAPARREIKHLSFDVFTYRSLAMSSLPSSEEIMQAGFILRTMGCSQELLQLLGLTSEDDSVPARSFHRALVRLGADADACSELWSRQMLQSTLLKLRGLSLYATPPLPVFSVSHALLYLCFKYNREFVDAVRPALRVVTEGDVSASSLMVVSVVSLSLEERLAPHTSVAVVTDGCYNVKVSLDIPLTHLVREGILRRGHKLLVCGAKMLLKNFCSPLECSDAVVLSISYNCTRPVDPTAALGLYHTTPPVVSSAAVHPLGGLVPSLRGVVERILPPIFIEQPTGNGESAGAAAKVVRNHLAQLKRLEAVVREGAAPSESTNNRRLVRLTSLVLTCAKREDVVVQLWEDCAEGCVAESLEECGCEFPPEGSTVVMFALTPSRSRPSHPFQNAKVLYTRARLDYRQLAPPNGFVRPLRRGISDVDPSTPAGVATDFAGLFLASAKNEAVTSFVVALLEDDATAAPSFCVMDVPCATAVKEIALTMPTTPFTPVIVQNSSFIRFAADDLGPDCLHVLANEFTKVLQRPASSQLRTVVAALESLRERTAARKSVTARGEEILRLRHLSGEARTDVRRFLGELNGRDVPLAAAAGSPSRLPYYMRTEKQGPISKGVVIPSPSGRPQMEREQKKPVATPQAVPQRGGRSHIFGNIIELRLLRSFDSGRRESVLLLSAPSGPELAPVGPTGPGETLLPDSISFEVVIQVGAVAAQHVKATMHSPAVFSGMLEQRLAMRGARAMAVDEGRVDYFMQRTKMLESWQRTAEEGWWWFLALSHVVTADAPQPETEGAALLWLVGEWKTLLDMLSEGLRDSLFMFSVDAAGEVTRAVFIKENCSLCDLMRE
ncbi:putative DNA repair protein BRCA2 [Trypanosoma conorhini]|uniref:Putative DNA repair protein BRCA2 n=1 Tax=Trypanosoma conorhini TaxID=83891 RepID=A0A3R7MTW1_9TRYP|nr:putative DNA repair protein BRCA2 [Trypanosoma conorhini]RNF08046.1 putative DNA repair protein BRCA2 [Trypanosoma conorhini]